MFRGSQRYAQNVVDESEGVEIWLDPGQVVAPQEPRRGRASEIGVKSPRAVGQK